jgi:serine/threonine-protein kinase
MVFDGNTPMSILIQHVKETPPAVSTRTEIAVPPRLEQIVHDCLAKSPEDRPATAEALGDMLAEVAATLPAWTRERAEKWWRANLPDLGPALKPDRVSTSSVTVENA